MSSWRPAAGRSLAAVALLLTLGLWRVGPSPATAAGQATPGTTPTMLRAPGLTTPSATPTTRPTASPTATPTTTPSATPRPASTLDALVAQALATLTALAGTPALTAAPVSTPTFTATPAGSAAPVGTPTLTATPAGTSTPTPTPTIDPNAPTTRLILRLQPGASAPALAARYGATLLRALNRVDLHVLTVPQPALNAVLAALRSDPLVRYAVPDQVRHVTLGPPNDRLFSRQWGLSKVQAVAAWGTFPGAYRLPSTRVKVAVVDTGVDPGHPDLVGQVDWADQATFVGTADASDDYGHGTHVAGIIAAATNNGQGVAGLAFPAVVVPLKVCDLFGQCADSDIVAGINQAINVGAQVINLSLGGAGVDPGLHDAIKAAIGQGVVVVAAAGNDGSASLNYPAGFAGVVAVAASCTASVSPDCPGSEAKASFSSYGTSSYTLNGITEGNQVAVAAPGEDVLSTTPHYTNFTLHWQYGLAPNYDVLSGTSMATPHVAALAALLRGQQPGLSVSQVVARLTSTADKVGGYSYDGTGWSPQLGYGRINAAAALQGSGPLGTGTPTATATATPAPTSTPTPTPTATNTPGATSTPTATATNTPTATATPTATNTPAATATPTATATNTPTATSTPTATGTPTATSTPGATNTPTSTSTATATPSATAPPTLTPTPVGGGVGPGTYLATDPAISAPGWSSCCGGVLRSNVPWAAATLTFSGSQVTYTYLTDRDGGYVTVAIDGQTVDVVNEYSSAQQRNQWRSYSTVPGLHSIAVASSGFHSYFSSNAYAYLQQFTVQ